MEPWDGPASIAFTDGTVMGAVLDRNGLRPSRYWVTADDLVIMASEVGVIDVDPAQVVEKGRLRPGRMFLVDTAKGRIVGDHEIKAELAAARPYQQWLDDNLVDLDALPAPGPRAAARTATSSQRQQVFGYTNEELKILIEPMARTGAEPIGSMGTDTPIAVLSSRSRLLFDYFIQLFAQVTNPPLDAIREELVTSHRRLDGARGQPARPHAGVVPPDPRGPARSSTTTSSTSSSTSTAYDDVAELPLGHDPVPVPGVRGRRRPAATRSTTCAARPREAIEGGATILDPLRPPLDRASWRRSRRCCSPARCTTT